MGYIMDNGQPDTFRHLPAWLIKLGSTVIAVHLAILILFVLAAPSGPWPTAYGMDMGVPPQFAEAISSVTSRYYLRPLGIAHNYHFTDNRTALPDVAFEVHLKDEAGQEIAALRFPDRSANFWVYHRQKLLARALGDDQPVQPRGAEKVAAPSQQVHRVFYWLQPQDVDKLVKKDVLPSYLAEPEEKAPSGNTPLADMLLQSNPESKAAKVQRLRLISIPEYQEGAIPRDRPLSRPSDWSLLLARSYLRYLCQQHNAHSAELVRCSQEPVMPALMFSPEQPPETFVETQSNFGDLRRDLTPSDEQTK